MELRKVLRAAGIVPVIVLDSEESAVPLAKALVRGGLPAIEITFRTKAAPGAIAAIRREVPEAVVGAGTLLTPEMVAAAKAAGAVFGVAPGFDPTVVAAAKAAELPMCPGVATASELSQALTAGCRFVKFFPAEAAGGVKMLKSLIAPYKHLGIRFMPTGGVSTANVADYLALPEVAAVGGTWLGKSADIAAGNWAAIRDTVAKAVELRDSLKAVR